MWKIYILTLLIVACSVLKHAGDKVELPPDELTQSLASNAYPIKGWHADFDKLIVSLLTKYPVKQPCENPVVFFKALAWAESTHNAHAVFREPPPLNIDSIGLFQLSVSDKQRYPCHFKNSNDVKNPILNIDCAVKILHTLEKKYPWERIWEHSGRYFSTLRWDRFEKWSGKKQSGFLRLRKYLNANGCAI